MKTWLRLVSFVMGVLLITVAASPSPQGLDFDPSPPGKTVKLIFIHHSTGQNWLADGYGNLGQTLEENNYFVSDTNYGWGPNNVGDRTDIPHWTEWFAGANTSTYMNALFNWTGQSSYERGDLADPGGENEIVMFKSCFPNSNLAGSPNDPPGDHAEMTVSGAKYVYNTILEYFATRPDKLFIVITAPPVQDGTYAANARAFNRWLMFDWLDNYSLHNVAVFDFYNVLTAPAAHHHYNNNTIEHTVVEGLNRLYYYNSKSDDHPSAAGSQKATNEFVPLLNVFYHRWKEDAPVVSRPALLSLPDGYMTSDSTPTFTWSGVTHASQYEIVFATDSEFTEHVDSHVVVTPTFTFESPLTDGTRYWRVRAYNAVGESSAWSPSRSFTLDTLQLPANGEVLLHRRPTFDWSNIPDAAAYKIAVSQTSTFSTLLWKMDTTTSTCIPPTDFPGGKVIYWRIRAQVGTTWGPWSETWSFTTPKSPSIPVLSLPANKAITRDYMPLLKWKPSTIPSGGAAFDHYRVQVSTDNTFPEPTLVDEVTPTGNRSASFHTIGTALDPNQQYYWRVRAYNVAGQYSSWSTVRTFFTALLPPDNLTPTGGEIVPTRKPVLAWDAVDGASGYTVQVSTSSSFGTLLVSTKVTAATFTPSTNLSANRILYWRVRANGTNGPSDWTTASFQTP